MTVPVNDPNGVTARLNVALCPALTLAEVGAPDVGPILKSGAGVATTPDRAAVCAPLTVLSVTIRVALARPVAVGAKVTLIVQVPDG